MNQTRTFLLIAWLAVAFLLFQQWQSPAASPASPALSEATAPASTVPETPSGLPALPADAASAAPTLPVAQTASVATVEIETDVLRLTVGLQGASILRSELLSYPLEKTPESANVVLLSNAPGQTFAAESGWLAADAQSAPTHNAVYRTESGQSRYQLAQGQDSIAVPFVWQDANGVTVTKTLVLHRGRFDVDVKQDIANRGSSVWKAFAYEQLKRVPPPPPAKHAGLTNPDAFSFVGSAWYGSTDKFEKVTYTDYFDDGVLKSPNKPIEDGWFGMLQHHFVSVWIPAKRIARRLA